MKQMYKKFMFTEPRQKLETQQKSKHFQDSVTSKKFVKLKGSLNCLANEETFTKFSAYRDNFRFFAKLLFCSVGTSLGTLVKIV